MRITKGKLKKAKKIVIYGPEGIGKSTFASQFPDPVFIDTEGSTGNLDVARFDAPSSWQMLMDEVEYVIKNPDCCKTLIIDTADWAEQLCINGILDKYKKSGIEEFSYGKGYTYIKEEFGRLLNKLSDVVEKGVNVVVTAHAQMRKFEQPDETGAYDRWELKLSKQSTPLLKEWTDMLLFANYKTYVVKIDGKNKAQGGGRVMYTTHHSCWDAKNRYSLAEELPFTYDSIRQVVENTEQPKQAAPVPDTIPVPTVATPAVPNLKPAPVPVPKPESTPPKTEPMPDGEQMKLSFNTAANTREPTSEVNVDPKIPKALRDLMIANGVDEWDIQNVVAARGYFTSDVPISKYNEFEPGFVEGCLVGAWPQVYSMILKMREEQSIPFD